MVGILIAFVSAFGFGAGHVLARVGLQHIPSGFGTLMGLLSGFVIVLALALILEFHSLLALSASAIGWLLLVALVNYPAGRWFNYRAVSLAGVARASPIIATSPLWAILLAVLVGGEELSPLTLLGTLAIVGGLALVLSEKAR